MLRGGGRLVVGRVVRENDEELRALSHELTVEPGEAVLEADRRREPREPRGIQGMHPLPRRELVRDLVERGDPADDTLPRDVLPERNEVGLPIDIHHRSPSVEDDRLIEQGEGAASTDGADVPAGGSRQDRDPHLRDRGADLVEDLQGPRVERALSPHGQIGWRILQRPVEVEVEPRHRDVTLFPRAMTDGFVEVDLGRRDVDGSPRGVGERDDERRESNEGRDPDPPSPACEGTLPGGRLGEQRRRERHDERDAEHARDHREAHRDRVGDL